ncbi:MAG: hypothetical protein MUP02_07445 [Actinobacteria bacterium]|nr:hypothetical protein [Actinomycetota bacterium]
MSKNILTKALLVLVVVLLSATLLTGCSLFSKTVTVKLSGTTAALAETYTISVDDGGSEGTITGDETLEITGLSIGKHTFYADSINYSGEKSKTVTGLWSITVTIPVE